MLKISSCAHLLSIYPLTRSYLLSFNGGGDYDTDGDNYGENKRCPLWDAESQQCAFERESVEWIGQESSGEGCVCSCFCSTFGFVLSLRISFIQATAQTALLIMPTPCPSCPPALPHGHMWLDILTSSFVLITRTRAESKEETALSLYKLYKNTPKNYTEKILMTQVTMMVWSLT